MDYSKDSAGLLTLNLNGKEKQIKLNAYKYGLAKAKMTTLTHTDSVVTLGGKMFTEKVLWPLQNLLLPMGYVGDHGKIRTTSDNYKVSSLTTNMTT